VFEDFFPVDDPDLTYYQEFKQMFDNDNDYLLVGIINSPTIFEKDFLTSLDSLSNELQDIPDVLAVNALTTIERPVISPAGLFKIPMIHPYEPERYDADSTRIYKDELLTESLVSTDGKATAILVRHGTLKTKENADDLVINVQNALAPYGFEKVYLAGKTYAQGVFVEKMQWELMLFLSASILLVIVFLAFAYRSWWGVIIPLTVVLLSTIWILGLMGLTGKTLDILMVLLPTIMFVVGMSDVVHIMTKYIEQLRIGVTKQKAIEVTFKEVGVATFLTSLTTSIGFLTLLTASIAPIKEFGLYTAIGVFMAFIVAFTLLPSCLVFLRKPKVSEKLTNRSAWFGSLSKAFIFVLRKGKLIIAINIILTALAVYGVSQIVINTYLIEDLPNDAPLKQSFLFFDENFGGSRPFEVTAEVQNGRKVFDKDVLEEIDKVAEYMRYDFYAGNIISPGTIMRGVNQAINGGVSNQFKLPEDDRDWKKAMRYINRMDNEEYSFKLTAKDGTVGRITARVGDIGSNLSLQRTEDLKQFIAASTDADLVKFKVTGTSNLIDKNNEYLSRNMFQGLAIAFGVVALIAGVMFKSLRMILITLIPNMIPLVIVAGIMGAFGITLKLSTSIIFTIAFGIAVDDTIHFISKLKIELRKKKPLLYALKRTFLSTGKAITVTSLILSGGFLTLLLSSFGGTFYTGLLISLTLIFALVIDLTLLPVLILYFFKNKTK
ncbi:RND family transporter, partial [Fulvivirga sp. RKSG066]|uniref:efflux RND transporter permease subunit n=1 Tax=Fulvivirga aurantia TaxID=2529383 RepID=UPI0012BBA478